MYSAQARRSMLVCPRQDRHARDDPTSRAPTTHRNAHVHYPSRESTLRGVRLPNQSTVAWGFGRHPMRGSIGELADLVCRELWPHWHLRSKKKTWSANKTCNEGKPRVASLPSACGTWRMATSFCRLVECHITISLAKALALAAACAHSVESLQNRLGHSRVSSILG